VGNVLTYTDTGLTNGQTYYYNLTAVNGIGYGPTSNESSATLSIPVNQPPTGTISYLSSGTSINGTIEIYGTASDSDGTIQKVEIKIDNDEWVEVIGTTSWSYDLDTTTLSNGEHTITIRTYDGTNYSNEISIDFEVNNPISEKPSSEIPWIWVLILMIIVIMILIIYFWAGRNDEMPSEQISQRTTPPIKEKKKVIPPPPPRLSKKKEPQKSPTKEKGKPTPPSIEDKEPQQPLTEEKIEKISMPQAQDISDGEIFEYIKKKFEDGKVSEEVYEDFKKRYGKE
jgi:hypothetical protein